MKNTNSTLRAKGMQEIDEYLYQPYHDSCHKTVWKKYIRRIYGCNYATFLRNLKEDTSSLPQGRSIIDLFHEIVNKGR
ncbi:MAG: hypothetical protein NC357_09260 [Bacteroides sp.]|nr:hypothetical protein [Bacteroides sp.]